MLDYTLRMYLMGNHHEIPLWTFFNTSVEDLKKKSRKIKLKKNEFSPFKDQEWLEVKKQLGGGSDPEEYYNSWALSLRHRQWSSTKLKSFFSNRKTPIAGYTHKNKFIIDISGFLDEDFKELQNALDQI